MKLQKAIELLTKEYDRWKVCNQWDYCKALHLGIEAMERIEVGRNNPGTHWNDMLPGETVEGERKPKVEA